jgi:hypothetical protein
VRSHHDLHRQLAAVGVVHHAALQGQGVGAGASVACQQQQQTPADKTCGATQWAVG